MITSNEDEEPGRHYEGRSPNLDTGRSAGEEPDHWTGCWGLDRRVRSRHRRPIVVLFHVDKETPEDRYLADT